MHDKKLIFGLTGQIASGKGTVAKYLEKKYQAKTFKFSDPLRDVLKRINKEITRENMQNLSIMLREKFGQDILAKITAEDVKKTKNKIIVVDGIRRVPDIKYLSEIDGFKLIKIIADQKIRYKRLIKRTENVGDTEKTYEQFLEEEQAETELSIPKVMSKADLEIDNNGNINKLYEQIKEIIKKFS